MTLVDPEVIRKSILAVCSLHSNAREAIKFANGSRHYLDIAKKAKIPPAQCSTILNQAHNYGLLDKLKPGLFKRKKTISLALVDHTLRNGNGKSLIEQPVRVRRKLKKTSSDAIKRDLIAYLTNNFLTIEHPFNKTDVAVLSRGDLVKAANKLFEIIEADFQIDQLKGLSKRFYESFAAFFSVNRINKPEILNAFSNLIKCYEPFFKQAAVIKESNSTAAHLSLNRELIEKVVSFTSVIKNASDSYWADKPIIEATIRLVYPFRHKEAHEARDYPVYEIERIVHYFFASLILITLKQ